MEESRVLTKSLHLHNNKLKYFQTTLASSLASEICKVHVMRYYTPQKDNSFLRREYAMKNHEKVLEDPLELEFLRSADLFATN